MTLLNNQQFDRIRTAERHFQGHIKPDIKIRKEIKETNTWAQEELLGRQVSG